MSIKLIDNYLLKEDTKISIIHINENNITQIVFRNSGSNKFVESLEFIGNSFKLFVDGIVSNKIKFEIDEGYIVMVEKSVLDERTEISVSAIDVDHYSGISFSVEEFKEFQNILSKVEKLMVLV